MHIYEKGTDITMLLRMLGSVSRLLKPPAANEKAPAKPEAPETVDKSSAKSSQHPAGRVSARVRPGNPQTLPAFQGRAANSVTQGEVCRPETRTSHRSVLDTRLQRPDPEASDKNQDRLYTFQTQLVTVQSPGNRKPTPLLIERRSAKERGGRGNQGEQELSMLLFLENTGGVVLTVSLKDGRTHIAFAVENDRLRSAFCAYLDELRSAIPGSENLHLCVQVAPEKIVSKIDMLSNAFHLDLMA